MTDSNTCLLFKTNMVDPNDGIKTNELKHEMLKRLNQRHTL